MLQKLTYCVIADKVSPNMIFVPGGVWSMVR